MRIRKAALFVALALIIGGAYYGTKGEEAAATTEAVHTEGKGINAAYGSDTGTNPGSTGSQERSLLIPRELESGKAISEPVPHTMAAARETGQTVSRGAAGRKPNSNYTSLGAFKITAYTAGEESTGKGPDHPLYGHTALSGSARADFQPVIVKESYTIASDWGVLPPGTRVYIEGVGERVVEDKGGAVKGQHIDVYIPDLKEALDWGVQEREVYVIEWGQ